MKTKLLLFLLLLAPLAFGQQSVPITVTCQLVLGTPSPVSITTPLTLPTVGVGKPINVTLAATGGTTPYSWSWTSGAPVPAGLNITAAGVISGAIAVAGSYALPVTVTDSSKPPQIVSVIFTQAVIAGTNP